MHELIAVTLKDLGKPTVHDCTEIINESPVLSVLLKKSNVVFDKTQKTWMSVYASYDLIGMPRTPSEIVNWVKEKRAEAVVFTLKEIEKKFIEMFGTNANDYSLVIHTFLKESFLDIRPNSRVEMETKFNFAAKEPT